jgi:hypothetical protein
VLVDPTGNLLEFKHYNDPRMMYWQDYTLCYTTGLSRPPRTTARMST